jgi:CHAT domain-containing protein
LAVRAPYSGPRRFTWSLEAYIALLGELHAAHTPVSGLDLLDEAFQSAEAARSSSVQRALVASAARAALGDPHLAALARKEQDEHYRLAALTELVSRLAAAPPEQQLPHVLATVRQEIAALRASRLKHKQEIATRFPDYANLIDPKPATIAQARQALHTDEALIALYVGADQTYVWAIPAHGTPVFAVVPLGDKAVGDLVAHLRTALDIGTAVWTHFPAFDTAAAHQLYSLLLAPVAAGWQEATSLVIVPHRALGQLPFALLVTSPAAVAADNEVPFGGYRSVPWLLRQAAITHLPSVNALVTLRALPPASAHRRAFLGFGDPYFSKEQQEQAAQDDALPLGATARSSRLVRGLSIVKVAPSTTAVANSSTLAQLARLPDTADEIRDIARALQADMNNDVFLGEQANENIVKTMNLADRKVIAFATHGLVPGDLNGLEYPALALSAPEVAGVDGDGLLTMDEILGLKLNADWVVLSACNTAAGEGAGSEALSGLGRAFFYAGAHALLVSHWPVETVSARLLTTGLFKRQADNPNLTRAEALRQTMLALLDNAGVPEASGPPGVSYAHPLFWAPFSLVGDGAGR